MTLPINVRWLILGGLALLLIGLGLGYFVFYSPREKFSDAVDAKQSAPLVTKKEGAVFVQGDTVFRVDTVYIDCPEVSSPLARPEPKSEVFTSLHGVPEFDLSPHAHMPAFTIHKSAPLIQFGAKVGMDPIQGFWTGSALARLSLGDFHVLAEVGLMRDLFFALVAIEVYFYSIL